MAEAQHEPLIRAPSEQTAINVGTTAGGSNKRAFKIAGFTLLACLLIAGQALTAYFVLGQKGDIKNLEEQANSLKKELSKGRSVAVPMKQHASMNSMKLMDDDSTDETSTHVHKEDGSATKCQLEAAAAEHLGLKSFQPQCDEDGNYKLQQCWADKGLCWCVDTSGKALPGTIRSGPALCGAKSGFGHMMALPNNLLIDDVEQ
uniref:Thyroglobulin type-1 domain-containing protein n=1 Tax=Esox lucius TaxID=8010 RepID=A0A3P8XGE1_ESOLU